MQILGDGHAALFAFPAADLFRAVQPGNRRPAPNFSGFPLSGLWVSTRRYLGSGDVLFHSLAGLGCGPRRWSRSLCAAGYALNYKRRMQRALEAVEAHPAGPSWLAAERGGS